MKKIAERQHAVAGEEEWDRERERRERSKEEINSCKTEEKMNVERITKIPSGKIVQEMEKKTKGLAGEQAWRLMP